ncbi:hypothetical protein AVEN_168095-1 [Araneus ventricosus]|uniref:Uncharacterized protein n=1 Tax=Araneus ventricosus TaxID=182803 RepID=A0A4Y2VXY1_ARAVE|nr:hypothetical protein AVEN_86191-1 [Araneus ventricosus]GBO30293.1 hypothetical protein AVEN_168095-1 [Araneus ventricosus]
MALAAWGVAALVLSFSILAVLTYFFNLQNPSNFDTLDFNIQCRRQQEFLTAALRQILKVSNDTLKTWWQRTRELDFIHTLTGIIWIVIVAERHNRQYYSSKNNEQQNRNPPSRNHQESFSSPNIEQETSYQASNHSSNSKIQSNSPSVNINSPVEGSTELSSSASQNISSQDFTLPFP